MLIVTFLLSLVAGLPLLSKGYFPMHDDLQVMRIFQLEQCFRDGQIPCRWAADMTFGYGQAMFNFYSAFPYYLGILFRQILQVSIVDTVKALFLVSLIASGLGMYYLAKEFFGKWGGFVAAALYIFAPYRALNVYVRGAMAESYSLAILPFLWLFLYRTIKNPSFKNTAILGIIAAAQISTHNISTMIYAPFTAIWALFWVSRNFSFKKIWSLVLASVFGVGLASFFILPVFFEKSLIQEELFTSAYSYYAAHFASLNQLFVSRFWGYGGSIFGPNDHMSFAVGWPHWWVGIVVAVFAFLKFLRTRKEVWFLTLGLLVMALTSLFLTHQRSYQIWEAIPSLSFVQFPWRFVGLGVFFLAFAAGAVSLIKQAFLRHVLILGIVFLAVLFNINYLKPEMHFYQDTDETKLSGESYYIQQKAAYIDYLPKTVLEAPVALAPETPETVSGEARIPNFTKTSSTFFFDAEVYRESVVSIPIIYFPNWEVYILDGQGIKVDAKPAGKNGTIHVTLPVGKHMVYGRFVDTTVRKVANAITLVSGMILAAGTIVVLNKRKFLGLS